MIREHQIKGNIAFLASIGWLVVTLMTFVAFIFMPPAGVFSNAIPWTVLILQVVGTVLWMATFYYWGRAKGYGGIVALLGFANLVGLYVLYKMPDRTVPPIPPEAEETPRPFEAEPPSATPSPPRVSAGIARF